MTDPKHDTRCELCGHWNRYHHEGHCHYPLPPYGQQCQTCNRKDDTNG